MTYRSHTRHFRFVFFFAFCLGVYDFSHAQIISTFAGNGFPGYGGDSLLAPAAKLNFPTGVAVDRSGNVYCADGQNNRIRKISLSGIISTIAGTGSAGYSGDNGDATAARLTNPNSLLIDSTGNVIFTDDGNHCIRKISRSGIISTVAGTGVQGYSGDGGNATAAMIDAPTGIAMDANENIYFADQSGSIRKITSSGIISTFAGDNASNFSGDGGPATAATFRQPTGLAFDGHGNLYIADLDNFRVRKISPAGIITTIAGIGTRGYGGDGAPATNALLNSPTGIAIDADNNIYVADAGNNNIRKINSSGIITTFAGTGVMGFSGDGGPASAARLSAVYGITITKNGYMYIADQQNNRIRLVTSLPSGIENSTINTPVLSIYPNPCHGSFTATLFSENSEGAQAFIMDASGRIVEEFLLPSNKETEIQLHVPKGVYFLSAVSNTGQVAKKLIVE